MDNGQSIRIMDLRGTYKGGGGPDKTIINSAAMHDKEKLFVLVTYLRDPKDDEFQIETRARELGIDYIDVFDGKLIDFKCIYILIKLIKKYGIRVIHAHDDKTSLYSYFIKIILPYIKIVYTCHMYSTYKRSDFNNYVTYLKYKIRKHARYFFLSKADRPILAVSRSLKNALIHDGIASGDIHVIHNGIDLDKWQKCNGKAVLRSELALQDDTVLIGTVARIAFQKDLPTFFRVAREVNSKFPESHFVIVGDGEGDELEKAKTEAQKLGVSDYLTFTGHRNDLLNIYASFDLFLMTSTSEGMPNTILEAMAMEIPVVSTAVDGVPEVIEHGISGFLTPIKDIDRLSGYVLKLIKDPALRQKVGQAGRCRIEKSFSFIRRVRIMEDYYSFFSNQSPLPNGV